MSEQVAARIQPLAVINFPWSSSARGENRESFSAPVIWLGSEVLSISLGVGLAFKKSLSYFFSRP